MPDQGLLMVIATGLFAVVYLALAVSNFSRGRMGLSAARLFAAVLFAGAALFIAYQIHLF